MQSCCFEPIKYIQRGSNSLVYEVRLRENVDCRTFAFKRYFLKNARAVERVRQERKVLELITGTNDLLQCRFFPMLYWAFRMDTSVAFVMSAGSGLDLSDFKAIYHHMDEATARFYCAEVLCGLEYLHSKKIVHLGIKPENILIANNGHIIVSDFDHSLDISEGPRRHPCKYAGTPHFVAPEVANLQVISDKADIWSWISLVIELIDEPVRSNRLSPEELELFAMEGRVTIKNMNAFSSELYCLIRDCFKIVGFTRPSASELKDHRWFKDINWTELAACQVQPPISSSRIVLIKNCDNIVDAAASQALKNFTDPEMINLDEVERNENGDISYKKFKQDSDVEALNLDVELANFDFEHPAMHDAAQVAAAFSKAI